LFEEEEEKERKEDQEGEGRRDPSAAEGYERARQLNLTLVAQ